TEATLYGLLEVIERDAWAVARLSRRGRPVDLCASPSERLRELVATLGRLEIGLEVHRLESIGGVHTHVAALRDRQRDGDVFPAYGLCAHPDPWIALEQAVIEATQSRLVVMTEAREDRERLAADQRRARHSRRGPAEAWLADGGAPVPAPAAPLRPPVDLADVVDDIVDRMATEGFDRVVKIRLNPPDDPLAVVRVLVPGASEAMHRAFWLGRRVRLRT
ncbi:MAG: YcaO-like family protein, partial [Deltaproteobacteria bacterium]|nr:YcaO-like family protein [Deltaproteobacteria bacterium]